jgi:predicted ArsR family transcriptional regulator
MRSRDRDDHIKTLQESGQIVEQVENTNGRPAKVFRLTGYSQASVVANSVTS